MNEQRVSQIEIELSDVKDAPLESPDLVVEETPEKGYEMGEEGKEEEGEGKGKGKGEGGISDILESMEDLDKEIEER